MGIRRSWCCYSILVYFIQAQTRVNAETVLILGGEVDNLLHHSVASVQSFGACGVFQSDIPPLPQPRREFAAAMLGEDLVLCGGYQLFSTQKDCIAITLGTWPLEWRTFPSMIH